MLRKCVALMLVPLMLLASSGCRQEVIVAEATLGQDRAKPVTIHTVSGETYTLRVWEVLPDGSVTGKGAQKTEEGSEFAWVPFEGKIEKADISGIETTKPDETSTLAYLGGGAVLLVLVIVGVAVGTMSKRSSGRLF